jgi:hypothetical protein
MSIFSFMFSSDSMHSARGSGTSAVKSINSSISTTLQKALYGSECLAAVHKPRKNRDNSPENSRDAFELTKRLSSSPPRQYDENDDERVCADLTSASIALVQNAFPLPVETTKAYSVPTAIGYSCDPLYILQESWRCCRRRQSLFIAELKQKAGITETEARHLLASLDTLVGLFENGTLQWNVLNGVAPLEEGAVLAAIEAVLCTEDLWFEKVGAVWGCAIVHLLKH